jgi:hypothetical protein
MLWAFDREAVLAAGGSADEIASTENQTLAQRATHEFIFNFILLRSCRKAANFCKQTDRQSMSFSVDGAKAPNGCIQAIYAILLSTWFP